MKKKNWSLKKKIGLGIGVVFAVFFGLFVLASLAVDDFGKSKSVKFNYPLGIVADSKGNLYVTDSLNHIIRKITPDGRVTTIAGTNGTFGSVDGIGTAARFYHPVGITIDSSGNLYVADGFNNLIRKIASGGVVTTLAGDETFGSVDGIGTTAKFRSPKGITIDSSGNLYVADTFNHIIRKIAPDGMVTTFAGDETYGSADGIGTAARFYLPVGITVDSSGNLYVADIFNHIIRKITPDGRVTTLAGTNGTFGSVDGIGTAARFYHPVGITVDSSGNLYVADSNNHIIQKITPDGRVTTLAGTNGTFGSVDGIGTAARFYYPVGITVDSSGNLYVADSNNHIIRKITPDGRVTTLAGTKGIPGFANSTGIAARLDNMYIFIMNMLK